MSHKHYDHEITYHHEPPKLFYMQSKIKDGDLMKNILTHGNFKPPSLIDKKKLFRKNEFSKKNEIFDYENNLLTDVIVAEEKAAKVKSSNKSDFMYIIIY